MGSKSASGAKVDCCACAEEHLANEMIRALVANELDAIRERLEHVGANLCTSPTIVREFTEMLQSVDELAQRNENLARLLRASHMEPVIDTITLEALKNRLLQGVSEYFAESAKKDDEATATRWTTF